MKAEKYCVKIKLRRNPTSEKSDLYEFKMALFDNDEPEEFLLFVQNFKIILESSGTIASSENIQYFCTQLCMVLWLASTATEEHCYMPVAWHI